MQEIINKGVYCIACILFPTIIFLDMAFIKVGWDDGGKPLLIGTVLGIAACAFLCLIILMHINGLA